MGIIVIAVVTSIVVTSLVWVCIIYQTRKKSEECSVTNTDETIVPPDVPSYLSSQGTLSERQDVCIRVEASVGPQPNGHIDNTGYNGAVVCTECMENGNSYSKSDSEYLPQGLGPAGLEYQQRAHPQHMDYSVPVPLGVDTGPYTAPLCNGTPNGVRRDAPPPEFPSNHNTVSSQRKHNRKGSSVNRTGHTMLVCSPSQEEAFHKPVKLAPVTHQYTLDTDCEPELRQTLLSNGHTPRASQSDSTPLRSASD